MSEPMDIAEACEVTDQFGRFIRGLDRLQEAAATLRNADQVVAERRAEADKVSAEIETLTQTLHSLQADADAARANVAESVRSAQTQAAQIIEAANVRAREINEQAKGELKSAQDGATEIIARRDAAVRELKSAQSELATVNARLDQAKAEGRKIFGGA